MGRQPGQAPAPKTGVLLRQEIRALNIIHVHAEDKCFKPASYDLRIGDVYVGTDGHQKFARMPLHGEKVVVPAYGSLLVSTREILSLPGNVVGRFDLRIRLALKGLFVQMGTQVEPHYHGRLFAILHNVSGSDVEVSWSEEDPERIFTIEFQYTSGQADKPKESKSFISLPQFLDKKGFAEGQLGGLLKLINENKVTVENAVKTLENAKDELKETVSDAIDRRFEAVQSKQDAQDAVKGALDGLKADEKAFRNQLIFGGLGIAAFSVLIPVLIGFTVNLVKPRELSDFDQAVRTRLIELQAETKFLKDTSNGNNRLDAVATRLDALSARLTEIQRQIEESAAEDYNATQNSGENPAQEQ